MRTPLVVALAALVVGIIAAVYNLGGVMDVSELRKLPGEAVVTVSGHLEGVQIGEKIVLKLAGRDGFVVTAVGDRAAMEAIYGPLTPASFESTVVVRGLYIPANKTLVIQAILRGCHSAYSQTPVSIR